MFGVYHQLKKKVDTESAVIVTLAIMSIFWFLIGMGVGAIISVLLQVDMKSAVLTAGSCAAFSLGYIYEWIVILREEE